MRSVEPQVFLISRPSLDLDELARYLRLVGAGEWLARYMNTPPDQAPPDGETLIEVGGRQCYRSWQPGLNPNVTKIREDRVEYLGNILSSGHGSVLEHSNYSFILHNVSRVFTHEIVRHRAGTAISQESMRFVRLDDIPMWHPEWAQADTELMDRNLELLQRMEEHQAWMAEHFKLDAMKECSFCEGMGYVEQSGDDDHPFGMVCPTCHGEGKVSATPFSEKKAKTSYMRRYAPDGVATGMLWTANVRALRHVISMRTDTGAEEEIRLVGAEVAEKMAAEVPALFQDFEVSDEGVWKPRHWKV